MNDYEELKKIMRKQNVLLVISIGCMVIGLGCVIWMMIELL